MQAHSLYGFVQKYPFWGAFICNSLLFSIFYLLFQPQFQTYDDPQMLFSLLGMVWLPAPSPLLLYSHPYIGKLLLQLYAALPAIPWYVLYLLAALWAAHLVLLYLLLKKQPPLPALAGYFLFFMLVSAHLLLHLQFTLSAALLCVAGFFLWMDGIREASRGQLWTGMLILLAGSMIRAYSCWLVLALLLPLAALQLYAGTGRQRLEGLISLLLALPLFVAIQLGATSCYSSAEWQQFGRFNQLRAQFVDYLAVERIRDEGERKQLLARHAWTENDYLMLREWFFMDSSLYNIQRFEDILAELPPGNPRVTPLAAVKIAGYNWLSWPGMGVLLFGLYLLLRFRSPPAFYVRSALLALGASAGMMWVAWRYYLPPERVYMPLLFALGAYMLLYGGNRLRFSVGGGAWKWGYGLLVLGVWGQLYIHSEQHGREARQFEAYLQRLADCPNCVYVVWGAGFPWEYMNPWHLPPELRQLRTLWLGPAQRTPLNQAQMQQAGITNLYQFLASDPRARLLVHDTKAELVEYLQTYMQQHLQTELLQWQCMDSLPPVLLYRVALTAGKGGVEDAYGQFHPQQQQDEDCYNDDEGAASLAKPAAAGECNGERTGQ